MEYKPGEIVEHKLNKEWLLVIEELKDTVKCRTKDFHIVEFFKFELRKK